MSCLNISGDFRGSVVGPSGLELGPSGWEGPRSGKDLGIMENDPGMEGSSERRTTLKKMDVVEVDFEKVECDRD